MGKILRSFLPHDDIFVSPQVMKSKSENALTILPGDPEATPGIMPLNIAMGATDPARSTLHTPFVAYGKTFSFFVPMIHMRWTNARTSSVVIF